MVEIAAQTRQWPADKVERWPIAKLLPYARNARMHSDAQVAQIAASIREYGWTVPALVDEVGTLIAGHGRVLAARQLGIEDIPTMVAIGWTESQIKAYRLADNKLGLNSDWDDGMLKLELADLQSFGVDMDAIGFSAKEIGNLFGDGAAGGVGNLADRFLIAPFSVLNAREGWWQDRKRAWLALGIQSELGRGETSATGGSPESLVRALAGMKSPMRANATPGGSPLPAADYSKRQRGDGKGRPLDG